MPALMLAIKRKHEETSKSPDPWYAELYRVSKLDEDSMSAFAELEALQSPAEEESGVRPIFSAASFFFPLTVFRL